jgi:hypothetical protein
MRWIGLMNLRQFPNVWSKDTAIVNIPITSSAGPICSALRYLCNPTATQGWYNPLWEPLIQIKLLTVKWERSTNEKYHELLDAAKSRVHYCNWEKEEDKNVFDCEREPKICEIKVSGCCSNCANFGRRQFFISFTYNPSKDLNADQV